MKNYNLIRIVEKLEIRKSQISQGGKKSFAGKIFDTNFGIQNSNTFSNSKENKEINDENKNENLEKKKEKLQLEKKKTESSEGDSAKNIDYSINEICPKHGLMLNYFAVGTMLLFCDRCILETNLKTLPLPSVTLKN